MYKRQILGELVVVLAMLVLVEVAAAVTVMVTVVRVLEDLVVLEELHQYLQRLHLLV